MPLKLLPMRVLVSAAVALSLNTNLSGQAYDNSIHSSSAYFRAAATERQRLSRCIDLIDRKIINIGMNIVELDQILGTDFSLEHQGQSTDDQTFTCKFGKGYYCWRLTGAYNGRGEVIYYFLNNLNYKGYSATGPLKESISAMVTSFHKARNSAEKLHCAVRAIDARIVQNHSKTAVIREIFGDGFEQSKNKSTLTIRTYKFDNADHAWRLITVGDIDSIHDYYLTNLDWTP